MLYFGKINEKIRTFAKDESGATAIEYGMIAALICIACIAAFKNFGRANGDMWDHVTSTIVDATTTAN